MKNKAIIVVDFAYKGLQRKGRGTGRQGLRATLKYLQYRDRKNNHLAQSADYERGRYERWQDRGMGVHQGEIYQQCDHLRSKHVLAWTWVISPSPDLIALVTEEDRRSFLYALTERIVEDYYAERGFDVPEYSYVMHSARTKAKDDQPAQEHLHTHVVLPGTAPSAADRLPVYNNASRDHDTLFREIATQHFANALDTTIGTGWRLERDDPTPEHAPERDDFFAL